MVDLRQLGLSRTQTHKRGLRSSTIYKRLLPEPNETRMVTRGNRRDGHLFLFPAAKTCRTGGQTRARKLARFHGAVTDWG